jgi:methionyl-tRNA formyltransferase
MNKQLQTGWWADDYDGMNEAQRRQGSKLNRVRVIGCGARHEAVFAAVKNSGHGLQDRNDLARPQVGICAGFPTIIKTDVLSWPEWGWLNCHAGPVPTYRGGSPLNWQIINGETRIGISILKMTSRIDDGPMLATNAFTLQPDEDISHAHAKANALFAEMVPQVLGEIAAGTVFERDQGTSATYWHQRNDGDGRIDWSWPAERVHNFVRALTRPYPGAWFGSGEARQRIWKTSLDAPDIRGRPGHIFTLQGKRYAVCGDRALQIIE